MKTWAGVAVIAVMLAGCTGPETSEGGSGYAVPVTTQQPGGTITQTAAPEPLPSIETTETEEVLNPDALKEHFGFADEEGKHILVTGMEEGQDEVLASLNQAIGNYGQVLNISFVKWQPGSDESNGREMSNNFANLSGYLFKVENGSAAPDASYYLADAKDFHSKSLLEVKPAHPETSAAQTVQEDVQKAITTAKKREIQYIGKVADLQSVGELYAVQFVRQEQDMLFSLVLREGDSLAFMDYPAVIGNGNEYSVWRVDDGGEITADMFSVLFAARKSDGILLGINWWGPEGVNTFFLDQQGSGFKELEVQYGRYTSPI